MATPTWANTFANLAGTQPASKFDANFAQATQVTSLAVSPTTPLAPTTGGAVGTDGYAAASDHQHPPQSATPTTVAGTTYSITSSDDGKVLETTSGSAVTVTFDNTISVGCSGTLTQRGAGQVTFAAEAGGNLRNSSSYTKTRAQWSVISWYCSANSGGTAAEIIIAGDMTT